MPFDTMPVVGGNPATLLAEYGESCTLINSDSTNVVFLADNNAAQPTDAEGIAPLGPGNFVSLDGKTACYGVTPEGVSLTVFKYAGTVHLGGTGSSPSATPANIATAVATTGNTVDLVGFGLNPLKLAIQITAVAMSAIAYASSGGTQFNTTDAIQDNIGVTYVPLQVGLPSGGGVVAPTLSMPLAGVTMPAGRKLQLVNGGGGVGDVHQVAAMISYYLINDM